MWYDDIFAVLRDSFDPERCYNRVYEINETDRWFDFSNFMKTADYCAGQMEQMGLADVDRLALKADGATAYGDWVTPKAWDVFGAELGIVQADGKYEQVADYKDIPACLMMYSAPTQEGGVKVEVIIAEDPSTLNIENTKGKIILTGKPPQDFVSVAIAGGAVGIVSDFLPLFPGVRDNHEECWKAFRWENNFMYPVNDTGLFGFSLSPEKGSYLREKVRQAELGGESIRLHAEVRTKFYDGVIYTVSGKIPGSKLHMGEVMVVSHLYEQGANDNATGCGLSLELASIIKSAVDDGRLRQPVRDIRFVMGFECLGLMGYSEAYPERISNTIAAVNLDMVGASAEEKSKLHLWHNPKCSWSFTDTLLPSIIHAYEKFTGNKVELVETGFSIGNNLLADPAFGVPTMSMLMHPALSYHTSYDTMDMVDIGVLKQNALISGAFALFLANPDVEGAKWLVAELNAKNDYIELRTLDSLLGSSDGLIYSAEPYNAAGTGNIAEMADKRFTIHKELKNQLEQIVPVRTKKGTLSFHTLASEIRENAKWKPYYDYFVNCPLFWTDGRRNLYEIGCLAAIELGIEDAEDYMAQLLEYYIFLRKLGYAAWNQII